MKGNLNQLVFCCLVIWLCIVSACSSNEGGARHTLELTASSGEIVQPRSVELETTLTPGIAQPEEPSEPSSLDEYIGFALSNSAELRSIFDQYQAALARSDQVAYLPDPTFTYGYFIKEVETRVGAQRQKIGFMQPIPWFGKLGLRSSVAEGEAESVYYSLLDKKNKLVAEVISAYNELVYLKEATETTDANLELLRRWEQVIVERYRSQSESQANLIKVQLELAMIEDMHREQAERYQSLESQFNALLNRSVERSIHFGKTDASQMEGVLGNSSLELEPKELLEIAKESNPELLMLDALYRSKQHKVELAKKSFYPDLSIGADYTVIGDRDEAGAKSGEDAFVAMFSATVPLYRSKNDAELAEAQKEMRSVANQKRAKYFEISAKISHIIFNLKDSTRKIELYKHTLVPKAEESLESTYTAFEAGEVGLLQLLELERSYLQFKLALARAEVDFEIAKANLLVVVGDTVDSSRR